jgi:hypothetical protein
MNGTGLKTKIGITAFKDIPVSGKDTAANLLLKIYFDLVFY